MAAYRIDLNSDVGESYGNYKLGLDEQVIPLITSANIACGFHAGDPGVMRRTISLAREHGVAVGAHPGLPDLLGFGRRSMDVSLQEIRDYTTYQIGALQAFAVAEGVRLQHVKAHGALYNMAVSDPRIWETLAAAMADIDANLILVVLAGSNRTDLKAIGERFGIRVAFEFFADRAYNPDGSLVARSLEGAMIHDHDLAAERVMKMATSGTVVCIDGSEIELAAETICVHGDNPSALALVQNIRKTLVSVGVRLQSTGEFL
ncbi:MAG: lactam utilization protein LamB [Deltaproteobacteria bacterium SG8_13]|nr:MAG: lactam utilization protein LamB [Deltaproteobacteria bacterium SG8_13]